MEDRVVCAVITYLLNLFIRVWVEKTPHHAYITFRIKLNITFIPFKEMRNNITDY